ncbi:hypothetical protein HRI_004650000 [Hibiscus trionum]|uniref:Integrase catalytic domain-containing protein n=1 Tax=Hibiscus trionum TaxID=183268 RepID=A0A9W7JBH9_HIBTR|nr:hypothetical protein HRI_004650000 [Hibiscus trionum]
MRKDEHRFVLDCEIYQRMKSYSLASVGLLQPLPISSQVFEDISMDFITGLPKSNGKKVILVVVDRLTKYSHFFSLPQHFHSVFVAHILVQEVIKLHEIPRSIVSDRDLVFLAMCGLNWLVYRAQNYALAQPTTQNRMAKPRL